MRRNVGRLVAALGGAMVLIWGLASPVGGATGSWTITSPVKGGRQAVFASVSCPTATSCVAVGANNRQRGASAAILEQWANGRWSRATAPAGGSLSFPSSVSCPLENWCVATGLGTAVQPHFDLWNGSAWSDVPGAGQTGNPLSFLSSVSCSSPSFCLAVGTQSAALPVGGQASPVNHPFDPASTGAPRGSGTLPFAEQWDGSTWSVVAFPASLDAVQLSGDSCPSVNWCKVVGTNGRKPFIATYDGGSWSTATGSATGGRASLGAVTCLSVTRCVAVGSRASRTSVRTLIESWSGSNWTTVPSPNVGVDDGLSGVSCASSVSCIAVGGSGVLSGTSASGVATLVEAWNGSSWAIAPSPSPGTFAAFSGVSCATAGGCMAVGAAAVKVNGTHLLAELQS